MATGWLGWSPSEAWHTPIPQIYVALDARVKWLRACNGHKDEDPAEKIKQKLRSIGR